MVYASWGRGVESDVAPEPPRYTNAGQALPAAEEPAGRRSASRAARERLEWNLAAFDISGRASTTSAPATPRRPHAAPARSTARSATAASRPAAPGARARWTLRGGAQWLHARREGTPNPTLNGQRPTNVPGADACRLQAALRRCRRAGAGAAGGADATRARAQVLPDNSVEHPAAGPASTSASTLRSGASPAPRWTWRAGVDNVFDRRAWRESPYQFGHVYLFPLAPRTWRLSLQADL